jgi:Protein of unknown function (DUF3313)
MSSRSLFDRQKIVSTIKEKPMKTSIRKVMALVMGIALASFVVSCASTGASSKKVPATPQTKGFLNGYYQYLQPGPEGGKRWFKPGINFSKYHKIMLDSIVFYFADDSEYKGIDAYEMKELADKCNRELVDVLNATYPIVDKPGPDVIRLRIAITDLKQSRPVLSAVTTVIPVGLAVSLIKKGAGGSWTGSGATSAEFMALDSMTSEVIAIAQDERKAGFKGRFTKWGSAEEAFKFWAERIKFLMDRATHRVKQ